MFWFSAPGCRSNYAGEPYTPVFNSRVIQQWLRPLSRECVENLKRIYVCANHFFRKDIETKYSIAQPDISLLEVERANPHLRKDAVPEFLPAAPLT